jgi:hypothetical protein
LHGFPETALILYTLVGKDVAVARAEERDWAHHNMSAT